MTHPNVTLSRYGNLQKLLELLSVGRSVAARVNDVRGTGCGRGSYNPYSAFGFSSKIFPGCRCIRALVIAA